MDDIWSLWLGDCLQFEKFLSAVNQVGTAFGISFTGDCGISLAFLDILTTLCGGYIKTSMYIKPTDSHRYLNRRSYHSKHTFSGMPFSQFRRAVLICSDIVDRDYHIQRMYDKFLNSGYKEEHLIAARDRAISLNRCDILQQADSCLLSEDPKVITCVINQNPELKHEINTFFKDHDNELKKLLGDVKLIVSERRYVNTAGLLFKKNGFSQNIKPVLNSQKCSSKRCMTSQTMNLAPKVAVNGKTVQLDFRQTCSTEYVIYLATCKLCGHDKRIDNFYFGQTINSTMCHCNSHRDKFKINNYEKSALSLHIMDEHSDNFENKLNNFDFGVVEHVSPEHLNRREGYYIYETGADKYGLNPA